MRNVLKAALHRPLWEVFLTKEKPQIIHPVAILRLDHVPRSSGDFPKTRPPIPHHCFHDESPLIYRNFKDVEDFRKIFRFVHLQLMEKVFILGLPMYQYQLCSIKLFPLVPSTTTILHLSLTKTEDEIDKARQHILMLEAKQTGSLRGLLALSKEKLRSSDLESRIKDLELTLELTREKVHDAGLALDADECWRMLDIANKERDDALDLVRTMELESDFWLTLEDSSLAKCPNSTCQAIQI